MASDYAQFAAAFPWFFPVVVFIFGACIGSFLNVVIYRVPAGQSVVAPGSHCACGQPIAWHDNIPVLSWFLLRGRARCCGRKFSFRYPFIELLTAAGFLACWLSFPPAKALGGMLFLGVLIAATFIDLDHWVIPDVLTFGGAIAGIALSFLVPSLHGSRAAAFSVAGLHVGYGALAALAVGAGLIFCIAAFGELILEKEAMGLGDVKLVAMIAVFCGWQGAVFALFGGAAVGTIWFLVALLWQKFVRTPAPLASVVESPPYEPAQSGLARWESIALTTAAVGVLCSALLPGLHGQHSSVPLLDHLRATLLSLRGLLLGTGAAILLLLVVESITKKNVVLFGLAGIVGAIGAFGGWRGGLAGQLRATVFAVATGAIVAVLWVAVARARAKFAGSAAPTETTVPAGEPAAVNFNMHVPFGPMLAIAGALYFLFFHGPVDAWFAQFADLL